MGMRRASDSSIYTDSQGISRYKSNKQLVSTTEFKHNLVKLENDIAKKLAKKHPNSDTADLRNAVKDVLKFKAVEVQEKCINNEIHTIKLTESGKLVFCNHPILELRGTRVMRYLGAKKTRCRCFTIFKNWQGYCSAEKGNQAILPDKLQEESVKARLRHTKRLNAKKAIVQPKPFIERNNVLAHFVKKSITEHYSKLDPSIPKYKASLEVKLDRPANNTEVIEVELPALPYSGDIAKLYKPKNLKQSIDRFRSLVSHYTLQRLDLFEYNDRYYNGKIIDGRTSVDWLHNVYYKGMTFVDDFFVRDLVKESKDIKEDWRMNSLLKEGNGRQSNKQYYYAQLVYFGVRLNSSISGNNRKLKANFYSANKSVISLNHDTGKLGIEYLG